MALFIIDIDKEAPVYDEPQITQKVILHVQ